MRYALVQTAWGVVGFSVGPAGLRRLILPGPDEAETVRFLSRDESDLVFDYTLWHGFQEKLRLYFDGRNVSFEERVDLRGCTAFQAKVYRRCRQVRRSQAISYGELARAVGRPGAARAVGAAMSRNRCPLVVPCHRVIAADGGLGGFSASGGTMLKQRMLALEGLAETPFRHDPGASGV